MNDVTEFKKHALTMTEVPLLNYIINHTRPLEGATTSDTVKIGIVYQLLLERINIMTDFFDRTIDENFKRHFNEDLHNNPAS